MSSNPKIAAELEALLKYLEMDPYVAAERPLDEVREELRASGIDPGPAEQMLQRLIEAAEIATAPEEELANAKPLKLFVHSEELLGRSEAESPVSESADADDEIMEADESGQPRLAMAANDGAAQSRSVKPRFFPLGHIRVDGVERQMLTDGRRVAVRLDAGEHRTGLWIDDLRVEITISTSGKLAVLSGYGRGEADLLLSEAGEEPTRHLLRWDEGTEASVR